jgi:hypothetical protein
MSTLGTADFSEKQDPDLSFLKGKQIINIGFINGKVEGGLAIDYIDDKENKRVVLGFNDLGMWKEWVGVVGKDSDEDKLKQKIGAAWNKLCEDKIHIVSKPFIRSYDFVNSLNEVVISLNIKELKIMSEEIRKYFSDIPNMDYHDCADLIGAIGLWGL